MISKMRGTDWGFFGFSGKIVSVDVEKIGDKFYPLYYEDRQIFIEDNNTLTYNCGVKGDSKCGDQFKIQLPEYIDYNKEVKKLENVINGDKEYNNDIKIYLILIWRY